MPLQSIKDDLNVLLDEIEMNGGSQPGAARLLGPFPFSFNTPGLLTGVTIYTPAIDDVVLNGFIIPSVYWNGTSPIGDIGTFVGNTKGWLKLTGAGVASMEDQGFENFGAIPSGAGFGEYEQGFVCTGNPMKVVVSQNGESGGADPGSTQGEAGVYLLVSTPSLV